MKSKEEILTWALDNRCKYESSKEMDYDTHLAIMDAMGAYTHEQTEKYKELIEVMDKLYEVSCDALYEHKIDPTGEMGKLYIKAQTLKTELGL